MRTIERRVEAVEDATARIRRQRFDFVLSTFGREFDEAFGALTDEQLIDVLHLAAGDIDAPADLLDPCLARWFQLIEQRKDENVATRRAYAWLRGMSGATGEGANDGMDDAAGR